MRSFDLTPLFRYSVGFDRLDDLFETAFRGTQEPSYPPYNIVKTGQDAYRITLAVAGFGEDELDLVAQENVLTVRGKANDAEAEKNAAYLHRGIARRAFEHRFQLAGRFPSRSRAVRPPGPERFAQPLASPSLSHSRAPCPAGRESSP